MRIDCHVHVVGNGSGGSGCWCRPRGVTRLGAPFMLQAVGLPRAALAGDLERLYADRLVACVRASSLDAAAILAQDEPHREDGTRIEDTGSFYVPNDYVLGLARRHPELLPAVSIHPARRDALDELDRCLEAGAVMLKCLPNCQNIDWGQRRYTRFLERMAETGLLLLAHTGSERALPQIAPALADPRVLTRPLEIGVTCIAAHCGTGTAGLDRDYFGVFVEMLRRFPRLYGDNSALAGYTFRARPSTIRRLTRDPEVAPRILHGSDVPVPGTAAAWWAMGLVDWRDWRGTQALANPVERDVQIKRAAGFGEETFTRLATLLRRKPPARVNPSPAARA